MGVLIVSRNPAIARCDPRVLKRMKWEKGAWYWSSSNIRAISSGPFSIWKWPYVDTVRLLNRLRSFSPTWITSNPVDLSTPITRLFLYQNLNTYLIHLRKRSAYKACVYFQAQKLWQKVRSPALFVIVWDSSYELCIFHSQYLVTNRRNWQCLVPV